MKAHACLHLLLTILFAAFTAAPAAAQSSPVASEAETFALFVGGLALVFAAVGGAMLYFGIRNRNLSKASESWPTAGGEILRAEISARTSKNPKTGSRTTNYRPEVGYRYEVAGVAYESSVIRFGVLEGSRPEAEAIIGKYPVGSAVAVRYNPARPGQATLESASAGGLQMVLGASLLGAAVIVVAVAAFVAVTRQPEPPSGPQDQVQQPN